MKKRVLVTGGSGYIGGRLCLHLAAEGYAVTSLCHSKIPSDQDWVSKMERIVVGDVRDESFLEELAEDKYEIVIHLVSLDHNQSNNSPTLVSAVNITPVWTLLDVFSKQGLKKFIYLSTAQVYGAKLNGKINESQKPDTQSPYGLTHQIGEIICNYFNNTTALRCHNVRLSNSYGSPVFEENNCWWLAVNNLCQMAYLEKKIVLQSDGSPLRDFIHGWDVCQGIQKIIETSDDSLTYNLSSGITISILDIAKTIKKIFKSRYHIELDIIKAEKKMNTVVHNYSIDNSLIRSIGFKPKWDLEQGIHDLFSFLEKNNA